MYTYCYFIGRFSLFRSRFALRLALRARTVAQPISTVTKAFRVGRKNRYRKCYESLTTVLLYYRTFRFRVRPENVFFFRINGNRKYTRSTVLLNEILSETFVSAGHVYDGLFIRQSSCRTTPSRCSLLGSKYRNTASVPTRWKNLKITGLRR